VVFTSVFHQKFCFWFSNIEDLSASACLRLTFSHDKNPNTNDDNYRR
jgi:hypothetical protein